MKKIKDLEFPLLNEILSWSGNREYVFLRTEESMSVIIWGRIPGNPYVWQEISVMWDNYPILGVCAIEKTDEELRAHILEHYEGWILVHDCLDPAIPLCCSENYVEYKLEEEEGEQ